MNPDHDLFWITSGALAAFLALTIYSRSILVFLGRTRRLRPPPPLVVTVFRLWFALLSAGALWLLLAGPHGLLSSRTGAR